MTIHPGENKQITVEMLQADGTTPLLFSSVTALTVELIQDDEVLKVFTLTSTGSPVRQGGTTSSFLVELTPLISASLVAGALSLRCSITITDATFTTSGGSQTSVNTVTGITVV